MKILFLSEDHSSTNYGVTAMLSNLADELVHRHAGMEVLIAATGRTAVPQKERMRIELIPPAGWAAAWRWSPGLHARLEQLLRREAVDVLHIHGVWSAGPWAALRLARQMRIPTILSVHGMWGRWFWEKDRRLKILKKKLYFAWVLRQAISPQVTVHALNPVEKEDIRRLLPAHQIEIIPNAIQIETHRTVAPAPERAILFLGRLHPIKGVELLIDGFVQANLDPRWQLLIAGPEAVPAYVRRLKEQAARSGMAERIKFIGPVFGVTKVERIRKAWVQVLPSFSEGQAMTNLETATYGVPSITTFQAGLCDWQEGGGLLVRPEARDLAESLSRACQWSPAERNRRGETLRQWVLKNYSFDATMPLWEGLYAKVAAGAGHE